MLKNLTRYAVVAVVISSLCYLACQIGFYERASWRRGPEQDGLALSVLWPPQQIPDDDGLASCHIGIKNVSSRYIAFINHPYYLRMAYKLGAESVNLGGGEAVDFVNPSRKHLVVLAPGTELIVKRRLHGLSDVPAGRIDAFVELVPPKKIERIIPKSQMQSLDSNNVKFASYAIGARVRLR